MPSKLDELKRQARETARGLDEKYKITSKLEGGARAATDALRKGVDAASSGVEVARDEISRIDREHKISETVTDSARRVADSVSEAARTSGAQERATEVAGDVKASAVEMFKEARRFYEDASGAARTSASAARLPSSVLGAVSSARTWARSNPGKAAVVSLAFVAGTRAGAAFSGLDVTLLGAGGAGNWMFHSSIIPYGLRKLSGKYETYLKRQEELLRDGELTEAEAARVKFERDAAKYVGAPLLGAFSVAAGAGLVYEAVTGGVVTGFPLNLVLGGNPLLSSIWLFGNGLVCFHTGYKFFMMGFGDQEDVARVVRDIKGLLPA